MTEQDHITNISQWQDFDCMKIVSNQEQKLK